MKWNQHRARVAMKEPPLRIGSCPPIRVQPWRHSADNELLQRVLLGQPEPLKMSDVLAALAYWAFIGMVCLVAIAWSAQ